MEVIALNASPRNNGNTAAILEAMLEGARGAGAATELVHLNDLDMKGCQSCYCCNKYPGKCAFEDGFTPYLGKIEHSDVVIIGTPVYIFRETALCKSLIERLFCFIKIEIDYETGQRNYSNHFPPGKKIIFVTSQGYPEEDRYQDLLDYLTLIGSYLSGQECDLFAHSGATDLNLAKDDPDLLDRARKFGAVVASPQAR